MPSFFKENEEGNLLLQKAMETIAI